MVVNGEKVNPSTMETCPFWPMHPMDAATNNSSEDGTVNILLLCRLPCCLLWITRLFSAVMVMM